MIQDISVDTISAEDLDGWRGATSNSSTGTGTGTVIWPGTVGTGPAPKTPTISGPAPKTPAISGSATQSNVPTNFGTLTGSLTTQQQVKTVHISTLSSVIAKTSVSYIIIKRNGDTLELKQDSPISLNEMISITKFINLTANAGALKIQWSTLISTLGIERHFIKGKPSNQYPDNTAELFIKLFDAE